MLTLERRNIIIQKLNTEGKIIVSTLAREFNVTEETIRRDIEKLEREGLATKTYGGAVSTANQGKDLPYKIYHIRFVRNLMSNPKIRLQK